MASNKISRTLAWIKNHSDMKLVFCNRYNDYLFNPELDVWEVYNTRFMTEDVESIVINEDITIINLKEEYHAK